MSLAAVLAVAVLSVCVGASSAAAGSSWWSGPMEVTPVGGAAGLSSVSCPTASQCTAINGAEALTFDPQDPASAERLVLHPGVQAVDCVSPQQCTGVAGNTEMTFDPTSGTVEETAVLAPITILTSVSCPSASLCVADGEDEIAFDPLTGQVTQAGVAKSTAPAFEGVSCVSSQQCTEIGDPGFERTFNPTTGQPVGAGTVSLAGALSAVTCPAAAECVGLNAGGREVAFNPLTGSLVSGSWQSVLAGAGTSVSCVSTSSCTAVDATGGEVTFNPATSTVTAPGWSALNAGSLQSVFCLSGSDCVAVATGSGDEVTFDPAAPASSVTTAIATSLALSAVACASASQCTAVGGSKEATFNPQTEQIVSYNDAALNGTGRNFDTIACPSTDQCTGLLVWGGVPGDTVTFNPQTGAANAAGIWKSLSGQRSPIGIACPSQTQCTAVDYAGFESTFDPTTGTLNGVGDQYRNTRFLAVSCPSVKQCTVLDTQGEEITFDPTDDSFATATAKTLVPYRYPNTISCPTTSQCTANGGGYTFTFDPTTGQGNAAGPYVVDPGQTMTPISCPTVKECVGVDLSGRSIAFDPAEPWLQTVTALPQAAALLGVDCVSADECVAVDELGQAFVTTGPRHTVLTDGPRDPTAYMTSASFSFSSDDDNATFECNLDDSGWHACDSPTHYTGLSAGSHTFLARAVDGDFTDGSPASETWTIPTPSAQITTGPDAVTSSPSASFSFSSDDSNATFQCSLDKSSWHTCSSPARYANLSIGTHTFQVEAADGSLTQPTPTNQTWDIKLGQTKKLAVVISGLGKVTTAPTGINCGPTCSHSFRQGLAVTLTAQASAGSTFVRWSGGGCTGTTPCQITVSAATTVKARFAKIQCIVPNVTGDTVTAAKQAIATNNCTTGTITYAASNTVAKGNVISQTPASGKHLTDRAKVNLKVSKGHQ